MKKLCAALFLSLLGLSSNLFAAPQNSFTEKQVKAIQAITHEYLVNNPEILVEVSQALQQKERSQVDKRAQEGVRQNHKEVFNAVGTPVVGNPKGNVNLVEFFDYQCVHCKTAALTVTKLINANKNLRVLMKQLPIFGPNSEFAAKAALASEKQGKFFDFSNALFASKKPLNEKQVLNIAKSVGLNTDQLKKEMQAPAIAQELKNNFQLAQSLGVMGTPAFVVSSNPYQADKQVYFLPGAVSQDRLQSLIDQLK